MIYKMKLWQKIFTISLLTGVLLFALCGFIIVVSGHRLNLDDAQREFEMRCNLWLEDAQSWNKSEDLVMPQQEDSGSELYITLYENSHIIYDTIPIQREPSRYELSEELPDTSVYVEAIEEQYFFTHREQGLLGESKYTVFLSEDITHIYKRCHKQLSTFFVLYSSLSVIAAVIMLFTSKIITAPIKYMNQAVSYISNNHYSYRLPVENEDELSELCENINRMSNAVEKNITNYKYAINNFTHEAKTPLTSIIGYADILTSPAFSVERKTEAAEYIQQESRRLNALITKIIGFLTIGIETTEKKEILLSEIIEMACLSLKLNAEIKNVSICRPPCEGLYLLGDEELLVVLVVNLLDNAIKASHPNGTIDILWERKEENEVVFKIMDYGIGIPHNDLENVMEVFYMVDKARSRYENGLGLGLAICKEIANHHNADIYLQSHLGKGTTVTVHFRQ